MALKFRDVPGFPGYTVSNTGLVWSEKRGGRFLKPATLPKGHLRVLLYRDDAPRISMLVHRLVAMAFHGPPPHEDSQARHLNGNPADNRVSNVVWGTQSENQYDRVRHGTHHQASKTHCDNGHEFTPENTTTDKQGHRHCRECGRTRSREYQRQRRATSG